MPQTYVPVVKTTLLTDLTFVDKGLYFKTAGLAADASIVRSGVNALQADVFFRIKSGQSDGNFTIFGTELKIGTVGGVLKIAEGANATSGVVTLVAGTATVVTTKVTATSRIQLTPQTLGTVTSPKPVGVTARNPGVNFTVTSGDPTDTSVIAWVIVEAG